MFCLHDFGFIAEILFTIRNRLSSLTAIEKLKSNIKNPFIVRSSVSFNALLYMKHSALKTAQHHGIFKFICTTL